MSEDRFSGLYRQFDRLVRYLRGRGRPEQDANDLAQDAMIATWSRIDDIQLGAEWSYAKKAAWSRAVNQAERTREVDGLPEEFEAGSFPAEDLLNADFQQRFAEEFGRLSPVTQQIFILRNRDHSLAGIAVTL